MRLRTKCNDVWNRIEVTALKCNTARDLGFCSKDWLTVFLVQEFYAFSV
jgi:hypothetical protein